MYVPALRSQSRIMVRPAGFTTILLLSDATAVYAPMPTACGLKRDCPYVAAQIIHTLTDNRKRRYCAMEYRLWVA